MGHNRAVDGNELGQLLEDRLRKIVPPGFRVVYSDDGRLLYSSDPGRFPGQTGDYRVGQTGVYVRDDFTLWGQTNEERIVNACIEALDALQDYIDEVTHDPWPGDRTPPKPYAEFRDAKVVFGYGAPGTPVLECDPIPLL
jgi:hypothetical protein